MILKAGRRFSAQKSRGAASRYLLLQLGLWRPRPELYARVDARIYAMLESGLLDEVRGLLAAWYAPELPPLSAIGYRQMIAHLRGEMDLEEAVMLMKRFTRQFVRRQANWFKRDDPAIHWFRAGETAAEPMEALIREFLAG